MFRIIMLMLISTVAFSQTVTQKRVANPQRVASLQWMVGSWVQDKEKETVMESWIGPVNGMMAAVNVSGWASGKTSYEFLRIADTRDTMSYYASPVGRAPVEFKYKEAGNQRVVFENLTNDYPQRIIYWKDGDLLAARIEGKLQGQERSDEWRFNRAAPPATGGSGG